MGPIFRGLREQFAAVGRKEYDQRVRYVANRALLTANKRKLSAKLRWKTRVEEPEDVSFRDDASEYQTEDYVQARQEVGVGAPLRRAWRGANGTGQERRHAIFRRVLHKVRPGEVSFHDDTFLRREARRPRQQS